MPAGQVLQVGTDAAGHALGLHPRLAGLRSVFNEGRLALVQRTGYPNSSRSHFEATDICGTANPQKSTGSGWLGRYLDTLPRPLDALAAWNTTDETPRALVSGRHRRTRDCQRRHLHLRKPEPGCRRHCRSGAAAQAMASNPAPGRPHLAFLNGANRGAIETLDRVAQAAHLHADRGLSEQRLRAGAAHRRRRDRPRHRLEGVLGVDRRLRHPRGAGRAAGGGYANLMGTLGDGLWAFYTDIRNQGLASDTTVIVFSEFGRRISENGSAGTDHGAAGLMMVLGGAVRGGLYGTAASLAPGHPTLENNSGDVRYETDFRSVYARMLDQWLGVNSVPILNGDFRAGAPAIF